MRDREEGANLDAWVNMRKKEADLFRAIMDCFLSRDNKPNDKPIQKADVVRAMEQLRLMMGEVQLGKLFDQVIACLSALKTLR